MTTDYESQYWVSVNEEWFDMALKVSLCALDQAECAIEKEKWQMRSAFCIEESQETLLVNFFSEPEH